MDFTSGMKEDIRQIRSFLKPPQSVIIVVQAVLLLLEQDELTTSVSILLLIELPGLITPE